MANSTDRIGKFEIIERLGEGSMGEVFLARDTIIGREVAIKTIRRTSQPGPDGPARLFREIQAASRLSHPNLVTIHEFGEKGGLLFMVMEHVAGDDLGTLFRGHGLTPREVLDLLAQVCDGLAYAHQQGLTHRNLKPANVRLGRVSGRPAAKILDTGLTRVPGTDPAGTAAHLATLEYTAPEVFQGGKVDGRADIFAVGVMLHEALSGSHPFAGDTPAAIAQRIIHEHPAPLDLELLSDISPAIQGVLAHALSKDPARRFATPEILAASLRSARNPDWTAQAELPTPVQPAMTLPGLNLPRPDRPSTRRVWPWILAALVLLTLAGGLGLRSWRQSARQQAAAAVPAAPEPAVPAPAVPEPAVPAATPPPAVPTPVPAVPAPQPAAPRPAPAALPALPKAPYATLDQAGAALAKDPQGVLGYLEPAVAAEPDNERAAAMRIVALYNLGRYGACSKAIHEAREAGHPLWPMALKQPALRRMLEQDAAAPQPHLTRAKPAPAPAP